MSKKVVSGGNYDEVVCTSATSSLTSNSSPTAACKNQMHESLNAETDNSADSVEGTEYTN